MLTRVHPSLLPRARILKVGGSNAHLGKSRGDALLRVEFRTEAGLVDSAAWLVHDLPTWLAELQPGGDAYGKAL
jgi:hypothetical protein